MKIPVSILFFLLVNLFSFANDTLALQKRTSKNEDPGLKLPAGFSASIFADNLGRARHIVATPQGGLFVKLERLIDNKGILRLRDTDGDGIADDTKRFGNFGGTGITLKDGYLYASSNANVFRYRLDKDGEVTNPDAPEAIIRGLINERQHNSKSIVLDNNGNIYVNIGAPSNSCQEQDRAINSKGVDPCPILEYAAGIWQFKADKLNQSPKEGLRYATGLRNVVGLDWNNEINELFVVQHGRDQLDLFPGHFTADENANIPAEEMFMIKKGANAGWPYCFYDVLQGRKVLSPEYGGDGNKTGRCEGMEQPIVAFPAHVAPNALLFYTGNMFPAKYKNGAFVAFHGSWNRSPQEQEGFNVAFVPFKDGKPNGPWEIFADGFAGVEKVMTPGQAKRRPCGLAQGPDGSLYVSDDVKGTIYKIVYKGN